MPGPSDPPDSALGPALRALRQEHGFTLERLAFTAGVTTATLFRIEHSISNPTWSTMRKLCEALDLTMVDLATAVEAERGNAST